MNMKILYEDEDVLVIYKPAGTATQTNRVGQQDLLSLCKNELARRAAKDGRGDKSDVEPYVALINRLDQPVEGIVLLAKNEGAARVLSEQIQKNQMKKSYYAAIFGKPITSEGVLVDYLQKDSKSNLSHIVSIPEGQKVPKNVKRSELSYKCIKTVDNSLEIGMECVKYTISFLDIQLRTGRHHQIRVQMSHAGMPLLGDGKYGSAKSIEISQKIHHRNVALCAYQLSFRHPSTREEITFTIEPEGTIFRSAI
ncbi:MAG: RluA family pseudouridine synthase [Lachnospiraceae bacterium]|nr:RluA family pseudouridine synthase [Lachnospiraceae bacterium]